MPTLWLDRTLVPISISPEPNVPPLMRCAPWITTRESPAMPISTASFHDDRKDTLPPDEMRLAPCSPDRAIVSPCISTERSSPTTTATSECDDRIANPRLCPPPCSPSSSFSRRRARRSVGGRSQTGLAGSAAPLAARVRACHPNVSAWTRDAVPSTSASPRGAATRSRARHASRFSATSFDSSHAGNGDRRGSAVEPP